MTQRKNEVDATRVNDIWTGKTEAEIAESMATQEDDFYRADQSYGDGRRHNEFQADDFSWRPITVGMSEEDSEAMHGRMADFFRRVEEWKKAKGFKNVSVADTMKVLASITLTEDDFMSEDKDKKKGFLVNMALLMGVRSASAKKRLKTFKTYREEIQNIAREVWDI